MHVKTKPPRKNKRKLALAKRPACSLTIFTDEYIVISNRYPFVQTCRICGWPVRYRDRVETLEFEHKELTVREFEKHNKQYNRFKFRSAFRKKSPLTRKGSRVIIEGHTAGVVRRALEGVPGIVQINRIAQNKVEVVHTARGSHYYKIYDTIEALKMSRTKKDSKPVKEKRPYRCRCDYCINGKAHKNTKRELSAKEQVKEFNQ